MVEEDQLLYNNENIVQFQSSTVIGANRKTTGKQMTPSEYKSWEGILILNNQPTLGTFEDDTEWKGDQFLGNNRQKF